MKMFLFIIGVGILITWGIINYLITINHTFKMDNKNEQIKFQRMLSEILFEFINLNQENFDSKINRSLKMIGDYYDVDRTYLFTVNQNQKTMTYSHEWCNPGINAEINTIKNTPLNQFPWIIHQLYKHKLLSIKDITSMPIEAKSEQQKLYNQGVKSLIAVPIIGNEGMVAFMGMDSVIETREWSKDHIENLTAIASIFYEAILQIEVDKEIEFKAYHDSLTSLANQYLFIDKVNEAIQLTKRTGHYIGILFIDLDNFKEINDTLGHPSGDEVLKQVATRLSKAVRKSDTVARYGGDEFLVMLNNITEYNTVKNIAEKIMDIFTEPFIVSGREFIVTASLGIALYPLDGENASTLIKNADFAMYEAKVEGKNQYALYTYDINDK